MVFVLETHMSIVVNCNEKEYDLIRKYSLKLQVISRGHVSDIGRHVQGHWPPHPTLLAHVRTSPAPSMAGTCSSMKWP